MPGAHSSKSRQAVPGSVPGTAAQPGSQAHVKEPFVLVQTAFTSQSCVPRAHSSSRGAGMHWLGNSSSGSLSKSFTVPTSQMQAASPTAPATECDPVGHGRHVTSRPVPHRYSSTKQSAYTTRFCRM
eukprot:2204405-Rhodomonas_salina.2